MEAASLSGSFSITPGRNIQGIIKKSRLEFERFPDRRTGLSKRQRAGLDTDLYI
jgi:hypothetical protein